MNRKFKNVLLLRWLYVVCIDNNNDCFYSYLYLVYKFFFFIIHQKADIYNQV